MFKFKKANDLLPKEMVEYIKELENEVTKINQAIKKLSTPNAFVAEGKEYFDSEKSLLEDLEIGGVVEAKAYREFETKYLVKISDYRIDHYSTRLEAEHVAMLHRL